MSSVPIVLSPRETDLLKSSQALLVCSAVGSKFPFEVYGNPEDYLLKLYKD